MRAITLGAAAACMLAIVTWQGLVRPVEAGQSVSEKIKISEEQEQYVPGEVLVLLSADADRNGVVEAEEDLSGIEAAVKGTIEKRIGLSRGKEVLRVKLPGGQTVEDAIAESWGARDRRILVVEPNYRVRIARVPNDVRFLELWGMNNDGQTGGTVDADIDAPEAWNIATGVPDGSDVIVGVIDSGVDYLHPDLAGNMWVNPGEIPDNGVDDDGNGYVDDVHGYDFYQDDGDPSDAAGHGTHCAGTIAGIGDNGIGVAGVNWRCKLMALRFLSAQGSGSTMDAIEAVNYGVANGARILSNSWGGGGYSQSLETAIADARDQGVLFVAAAGNSGVDNDSQPHYPSSYDVSNVISVAATDDDDALASFSSYGAESVDLGAPGVGILSTVPKFRTLFAEDFQDIVTPGFGGTQMVPDGPENRWGTVLSPIGAANNIAARGDWANTHPYLSGSDGSIVTPALDTRGLRGITMEFNYSYEIGNSDELSVDVWDGTTWQKVFDRSSACCYHEDYYWWILIDIPDSYRNEEMKVRFRWFTDTDDADNNYFGAEIDDIHIQCIDNHAGDYVYKQGTSMATPHVAGVAALVMANLPGSVGTIMSLEELKSRILWTGDPIPALDGMTVTGRRLNAYNALATPPGVKVVAPNGGESWELSSTHDIEWYSIGIGSVLDIYLYKGGSFYSLLAEDVPGSGKFTWNIPVSLPSDSDFRILITDGTNSDESDGDFELYCETLIEPNYPDPCNGARDVGVDTDLIWNFWGPELEPCTITFDGLQGTRVDGMIIGDVTFGFSSDDASIGSGPGDTLYVEEPYIEGDAMGTMTLEFAIPVFGVSYGFVLSDMGFQPDASTMVFYDSMMSPIGTFSADAGDMGFDWMEGLNIGTSTRPIARVEITFSHPMPDFARFALDNITYSPIPGGAGLPAPAAASESAGMDEAEGEEPDANEAESGFQQWVRLDLPEYQVISTGVRPGEESGLKGSEASETIATAGSIDVLHSGGPDAGDYIFVDSYDPNGPSFDWIEIGPPPPPPPPPPFPLPPPGGAEPENEPDETIIGTHLDLTDDSHYYAIELPFSFNFYGSSYNRVAVGSNGTIYFENEYLGFGNCCIPCNTTYDVKRFIAVYWDDLNPNPIGYDNVYYSIVGEAPNRILVVQWERVRHFGSQDDRVTCQAQLFEGSNEILLLYKDPSSEAGLLATVGIQRDSETGLNYICSEPALEPNLAVLFKYQPPCPTTWDVYLGTDPNAMELIESGLTDSIYDPTPEPGQTLMRGMRYYWKVVVKNCCNAIDGNDWSFTTVNIPPVADAGADRIVECACNTAQGTQVTLDGTGSSDADGTPLTYTWTGPFIGSTTHGAAPTVTLNSGCPGEYVITLVASDTIADSEPNQVLITVVDTTPPAVNCPPDVTLECPADTSVEANGSATATDMCSFVTITHTDQWQPACGNTGTMMRTWTAVDAYGNSTTCVQTITVVDTTPPQFEFSVTPTSMWPPSHKMVEITPNWTAGDECDAAPQVSLVDIVMSEDDNTVGTGNTTEDIHVGENGEIYVRSERSGTNSGRIYTITYQAVDDCGNVTVRSATVSIPHDFKVLAKIADRWLLSGREGSIQVDFNNDGIVNLADFATFAENWIR
jgi:subtilisin family serine protease